MLNENFLVDKRSLRHRNDIKSKREQALVLSQFHEAP